ncbi:unnamed protein product [Diamesa serratosioi]
MVPEILSSNLCSLLGNVERFVFGNWTKMLSLSLHASYEEAQIIIDDPNKNDEIAKSAKVIKERRTDKVQFLQNQSQQCGNITFHSFDLVVVRLSFDSTNIQHEKLGFKFIDGFSVESIPPNAGTEVESIEKDSKRKSKECAKNNSKKNRRNKL